MNQSHEASKLSTDHASVTIDPDGIATLVIEDAGVLNILSSHVVTDLTTAIQRLAAIDHVRVLVVRGTGERAFIGGADIKEMARMIPASARTFITNLATLCEAVRRFPTPVIARMPGWSLGAGLELAAACDFRIASDDARFGMPEVAVGIPSVIHGALLPRLIGVGRSRWLLLTGKPIDAATALAWGLINETHPHAELDAATSRAARQLLTLSAPAVRQQKRLLWAWEDMVLDDAVRVSIDEFASSFESGEPQRIMSEFAARRRGPS